MFQKIAFSLLLIISIKTFSQNSKFSIEASYPTSFGDNFFNVNYEGILDVGVDYQFYQLKNTNFGFSINGSYSKKDNTNESYLSNVNVFIVSPRFFSEFNFNSLKRINLQIGAGYSFLFFNAKSDGSVPDFLNENFIRTEKGVNINLGLSYDITERIFLQTQYDFIKIGVQNDVPNKKFNTNFNILKFGLGFRM